MMKRLFLFVAVCALMAVGCKDGVKQNGNIQPSGDDLVPVAVENAESVSGDVFSFDELFTIFSCFGDNVMSEKFAPQSVKDGIKDELKSAYDGYREFIGPCNQLSHSLFDGNCYDGFEIACYRYKADGHILVLLSENGGCDVSSVKYIRAYEYDPAAGSAHEVAFPLYPQPRRDDFEDMVRLAGADLASLRKAMKGGNYDYGFRADGLQVRLNDPMDFDEQAYHGALVIDYLWDGAQFVRNEDFKYPCIHADGFANILLGREAPDFHFDYDPKGYKVTYSEGGDLWLIERDGVRGLEIQMDGGQVYSVEVRFPQYCVAAYAYAVEPGKQQPSVGACINDCLTFGAESPQVWMLMDGTVQIEDGIWNSKIAFRTARESLINPVEPSFDGRIRIDHPQFKPDAKIESILVWR